ncbi:hypothetical protein SteCoe_24188 [Stentor coeruleus]|uniref:Uncharacterized protein n=1 Tax=Stentor coeruleus TaxID=5963 RepID=A0A1R2BIK7_9CILI|nr:hypothetical protein SteCoe_24188 [Stentor coeruleus]
MSSKTNITQSWIEYLSSYQYSLKNEDCLQSIYIKKQDKNATKIKITINEEECWYVVCSYFNISKMHNCTNTLKWDDVLSSLNEKCPIGFFMITEKDETPNKMLFTYKTHQRFVRNDDHVNIKRTIQLIFSEHQNYFDGLVEILKTYQPQMSTVFLAEHLQGLL